MSGIKKKLLIKLYVKEKFSSTKLAVKLGVSQSKVLYWLRKYDIPRRGASFHNKKYFITEKQLRELYVKKRMSSQKIADLLGIKWKETILQYLKKFNISRRTQSEIRTKYLKRPFLDNLKEKAYLIGLRAGDISANRNHNMVRVCTATTHRTQVEMFKKSFEKYCGHVHIRPVWNANHMEWQIYCDLDCSFEFLLNKIKEIPSWILNNKEIFYSFLAGYMDCESSWDIRKSNKNNVRFSFRIRTSDKRILIQLLKKLEDLDYKTSFYLERPKGSATNKGKLNRDFFCLSILQRKNVVKLAKKLITLSKHKEKIIKMQLIIEEPKNKRWNTIKSKVLKVRNEIKKEHINTLNKFSFI